MLARVFEIARAHPEGDRPPPGVVLQRRVQPRAERRPQGLGSEFASEPSGAWSPRHRQTVRQGCLALPPRQASEAHPQPRRPAPLAARTTGRSPRFGRTGVRRVLPECRDPLEQVDGFANRERQDVGLSRALACRRRTRRRLIRRDRPRASLQNFSGTAVMPASISRLLGGPGALLDRSLQPSAAASRTARRFGTGSLGRVHGSFAPNQCGRVG